MNLYVYCPRKSQGAFELAQALDATRLRRFDGEAFWVGNKRLKFKPEDVLICWGTGAPELEGVRVLNACPKPMTKFEEISALSGAGVVTVPIFKPSRINDHKNARANGYLGRNFHHVGGNDLLVPTKHPDYFVELVKLDHEYRVHSFDGRSIRAGKKVPREGFRPCDEANWRANSGLIHPWIRSFDGGWKIQYDDFQSVKPLRELAHKAVKALGLTFGAVDIGETLSSNAGKPFYRVLEVNRAPGIEGNSISSYVRAIKRWINGQAEEPEKAPFPDDEGKIVPATEVSSLDRLIIAGSNRRGGLVRPRTTNIPQPPPPVTRPVTMPLPSHVFVDVSQGAGAVPLSNDQIIFRQFFTNDRTIRPNRLCSYGACIRPSVEGSQHCAEHIGAQVPLPPAGNGGNLS